MCDGGHAGAWRTLGADHARRARQLSREGGWLRGTAACRLGGSSWLGVGRRQRRPVNRLAASPQVEGARPGSGGRVDAWCEGELGLEP